MDFIVVQDTDIVAVNRGKREKDTSSIIYRDKSGSLHNIDFHSCALNFKAEHNTSSCCVGERNIAEAYFIFYTSGAKTKVVFTKRYVTNLFSYHLLSGSRVSRFLALQKLISETHFSTYDLS